MGQVESQPVLNGLVPSAEPAAAPAVPQRKDPPSAQKPRRHAGSLPGGGENADTTSQVSSRSSFASRAARSPLSWAAAGAELVASTTADVALSTMSAAMKTASMLASTTEAAANVVAHTTTNVALNTASVATQTASLITTATSAGAKTAGDAIAGTASMVVENFAPSAPNTTSPKHVHHGRDARTRSRSGDSSGHISPISRGAFFATTNNKASNDKMLPEAMGLGAITTSSSHDNLSEVEQKAPMRSVGTRFWCMVGATNTSARRHWVATVTNSKPTAPSAKYLRKILALAWETKGQSIEEYYRLVQLRPITTSPNCALKALITSLRIIREGPPEALELSTTHVGLIDAVGAAWAERVLLDVAPSTATAVGESAVVVASGLISPTAGARSTSPQTLPARDELMDQMLIARLSGLLVQKMHFHSSRDALNARYEVTGNSGSSNSSTSGAATNDRLTEDEEWERNVQLASSLLTLLGTIEAVARLALGIGRGTSNLSGADKPHDSGAAAISTSPSVAALSLSAVLIEEALSAFDALSTALVQIINTPQRDQDTIVLVRSLVARYQESYRSLRAYCEAALKFPYVVALNKVPKLEEEVTPLSRGAVPLARPSSSSLSPTHALFATNSFNSTTTAMASNVPQISKASANQPPSLAARPFTRRSILETLEEEELLEDRLKSPAVKEASLVPKLQKTSDSSTPTSPLLRGQAGGVTESEGDEDDSQESNPRHHHNNNTKQNPISAQAAAEEEEECYEDSRQANSLWIGATLLSNSIEHARPPSYFCLETEDEDEGVDEHTQSGEDGDNEGDVALFSEGMAQTAKPVRTRTLGNPFDTGNSSVVLLAEAHRSAFSTLSNPFASGQFNAFATNQLKASQQHPQQQQQPPQQQSSTMKELPVMSVKQKQEATKRALEQCDRLFEFSGINLRSEDLVLSKDLIGRGAFSIVHRATLKSTGQEVAVKELLIEEWNRSPEAILDFRAEVAVMKAVHHPNVLQLIGASTSPNLRLISEFCHRGNLFDLLYVDRQAQPQQSRVLNWSLRLRMALGEARGMHFLHTAFPAPLIHRDLKSLNLLLSKNWTLKVSDFGLSRFRRRGVTDGPCGTTQWMAPEVIQGKEYDERADVYSFGINLWELCSRRVPWDGRGDVKPSVVKGERPALDGDTLDANCPVELLDLIRRCWSAEPNKRPDFGSIVNELKVIASRL